MLNASVCHPTVEMSNLGHAILVVAYNPLGWPRKEGVRVPLNATQYASWTVTGGQPFLELTCAVPGWDQRIHLVIILNPAGPYVHFISRVPQFPLAPHTYMDI